MTGRFAALPLALGLLLSSAFAAEKKPRAGNPPAAKMEQPRPSPRPSPPPAPANAGARGGGQPPLVDKLLKMTPSEREQALSALPPQRRENIEKRLDAFQKLPPAQQNRLLYRAEVLQSLPPQRANQIRRSAKMFQAVPDDRKPVLNQEMNRMMRMPDEQRRERMNSEEFRNRYSANEQQMMQDLMEIRPEPQP